MDKGKPEYGKMYALTGATGSKCIMNGSTWKESEIGAQDVMLRRLAELIESHQKSRLLEQGFTSQVVFDGTKTKIKPGRKYTKIDIGNSGRFMVDKEGNVFGIKAYGQVHLGHQYGTLETIHEWNWGDFYPVRKKS